MKITKKQKKQVRKKQQRTINIENYFLNTYGVFKICKKPKRKPDYVSDESRYYYLKNGNIIRESNHWSNYIFNDYKEEGCKNIASCFWELYIPKNIKEKAKKIESYMDFEREFIPEKACGKINVNDFKNVKQKFFEKNFLLNIILKNQKKEVNL